MKYETSELVQHGLHLILYEWKFGLVRWSSISSSCFFQVDLQYDNRLSSFHGRNAKLDKWNGDKPSKIGKSIFVKFSL